MGNENLHEILKDITLLKQKLDNKEVKKLKLDLVERIINRMGILTKECDECTEALNDLTIIITRIKDKHNELDKQDYKDYQSLLTQLTTHLEKKHKLIREGHYTNLYMSLGIALGLPFGAALDNIAIGIPIGLSIGLAIGSSLDADAKKKGLII
ncbi:MAG: hypothetical protein APF84_11225 [Gracilibacter sp. BRH_c7a]|nr:MAG: hypothetical protein APF84_11225 [Gracilibacter sp. BRH_c7a]